MSEGFKYDPNQIPSVSPAEAVLETGKPVSYTALELNGRGEVISSKTMIAEPGGGKNSLNIREAKPDDFRVIAGPAVRHLVDPGPDLTGVVLQQAKRFDEKGNVVSHTGTVIVDSEGTALTGDIGLIRGSLEQ